MPLNSIPPTTTVDGLEIKRKCARVTAHVDVGFWGGAVPGNIGDLRGLHDAGVFGFKCFMTDSGVEEFPPLSVFVPQKSRAKRRAMVLAGACGGTGVVVVAYLLLRVLGSS